jgi:hypothetical protein
MTFRGRFEDEDFRLEDELTKQRDERSSPVVLLVGLVGLIVGLFVWGSIAMSVLSSGEDANAATNDPPAASDDAEGGAGTGAEDPEAPIDCADLKDELALSPARQAQYREQCETPTAEPSAAPAATATPDTRPNRGDCNIIRGTAYNSPEERQWFLTNCVGR